MIDGAKRWIGLGHVADIVIIWARDTADSKVKAFVLEKNADGGYPDGYEAEAITGKIAKRAIQQAHIEISGLRIPAGNKLAKSSSFRDVSAILNRTRSTVAWEALGHALAAYEAAAAYVQERVQFGKPIASYQLVQNKLANMLADLTAMQLLCFRTATLQDEGRLTNEPRSRRCSPASTRVHSAGMPVTSSAATDSFWRTTSPATSPTWKSSTRMREPTSSSRSSSGARSPEYRRSPDPRPTTEGSPP